MTSNQVTPSENRNPIRDLTRLEDAAEKRAVPKILVGLGSMVASGLAAIAIGTAFSGIFAELLTLIFTGLFFASAWTIWKQAQSEESISQQETLLREAFHSVLTPQIITDGHGNAALANRAFKGWIDLRGRKATEALSERFSATPATFEEFNKLRQAIELGQPAIAELPVMRSGKVVEWRRIVARPIDGVTNFYHWRFEDISERRRMERAMRDEQNKLLDFMAHAPVGIYSVDQHGRFRFANKTLAEWLQVTPEELVKGDARLHDVLSEAPKGIAAHAIVAGAQGEMRGDVLMRRRDGSLFPVAITQTVVKDEENKSLRTRSIVRDLSPEREWAEALSVSEYRFQRLFAEAPIGILLIDSSFTVLECNYAFHSILRRPQGQVVGSSMNNLVAQRDQKDVMKNLETVLSGGDLTKPIEAHMMSERETICLIYVKRFGLAGSPAAPQEQPGLMLYFIDATEQKMMQTQFAQSQKMQAIGQLAGGVAHDFNNLLTAMIGFCDLLLQRHKPGDQSFNDIMQIKQNGNRAANLVRQLLAFSRQQTLQPVVLNLVDILSELSNLLRRLIGANVQLDTNYSRDTGLVKADQGQLEQVIINLVVNARDAMPQGGTVTIRAYGWQQEHAALMGQDMMPPGAYSVIRVGDTGTGIPKEIIQRIFEPFFSTKEIGSGTGLGLSTVYGIVRQTGGFINVESQVGKGSTFTIYFPTYVPDANAPQPTVAIDDSREDKPGPDLTGAGTVLLVEDEDAVRVFSTRALRNKGYNVLEARSGEEALSILEKEGSKVDLTVTDVVMPQMDGPTLYKKIREKWPNMKVIFVSGYTEDRLREQFTSGEVIYFLPKPFTLKQLAGKVKEVLGGA